MRIISLILVLFIIPPAHADLGAARLAYQEGRWADAALLAQTAGGAEGYAFAAGAIIAQLMVEPEIAGREALADEALELAEAAYRIDREHVEARLRLAGALGYRGRYMSGIGAYMRRIPQRGRRLIEGIVENDPNHAWAVGMLGAWHLEVARRGGDRGLDALDASIEAGIGYYTQAIALDPYNPAPRFFLAVALFALGDRGDLNLAAEQLHIAITLEPRDAFETGIIHEAEALSQLVSDPRAAREWCNRRMVI